MTPSSAVERRCPECDASLTWRETNRISGVGFDYYEPCQACAALVCFNRAAGVFDVLIPGVQPPPRGNAPRIGVG